QTLHSMKSPNQLSNKASYFVQNLPLIALSTRRSRAERDREKVHSPPGHHGHSTQVIKQRAGRILPAGKNRKLSAISPLVNPVRGALQRRERRQTGLTR